MNQKKKNKPYVGFWFKFTITLCIIFVIFIFGVFSGSFGQLKDVIRLKEIGVKVSFYSNDQLIMILNAEKIEHLEDFIDCGNNFYIAKSVIDSVYKYILNRYFEFEIDGIKYLSPNGGKVDTIHRYGSYIKYCPMFTFRGKKIFSLEDK